MYRLLLALFAVFTLLPVLAQDQSHELIFRVKRETPVQSVDRPWLGIALLPLSKPITEYGGQEGQSGVELTGVVKGSPAEKAGFQKGDVVIEFNGKKITEKEWQAYYQLIGFISECKIGDKVSVKILRDKKIMEIEATLGQRPETPVQVKEHPELEEYHKKEDKSLLEKELTEPLRQNLYAVWDWMAKCRAWKMSEVMITPESSDPFRLKEINYILGNPLDTPIVAEGIAKKLSSAFLRDEISPIEALRNAAELLDVSTEKIKPKYNFEGIDEFNENFLSRLITIFEHALELRAEALKNLSQEEIEFLYDNPCFPRDLSSKEITRVMQLAAKIDYEMLFAASAQILTVADRKVLNVIKSGWKGKKEIEIKHLAQGDVVYAKNTKIGPIIVGGHARTIYKGKATIIIDTGGDDVYSGAVASSTLKTPFSLCIDVDGNDVYKREGEWGSQVSALLGGAVLIDMNGNDIYHGRDATLGCAIFGVALLLDFAGDDQYQIDQVGLGAGVFGVGFLVDLDGTDNYFAHRYAQGFASTKGIGALIDKAGHDTYFAGGKYEDFREPGKAFVSLSQGFSIGFRAFQDPEAPDISGGIGVLVDSRGNDTYIGDYFCQGSSYWFSLGVLLDSSGHDKYIASRYSQGAGIHLTAAALIDEDGDDRYYSKVNTSQGNGHDLAVGVLVDKAGGDIYLAGDLSQGGGNDVAIGMLIDLKGNDSYSAVGNSQGGGNYNEQRKCGSFGILIDLDGTDSYNLGGKNNTTISNKCGIVIDTQKKN